MVNIARAYAQARHGIGIRLQPVIEFFFCKKASFVHEKLLDSTGQEAIVQSRAWDDMHCVIPESFPLQHARANM